MNRGTPQIYFDAQINPNIVCNEPLDIVNSLPEFDGKFNAYDSWRSAVHVAYKVFAAYDGSSRHYQALGIIRNKIKGRADVVLTTFKTPLNFKAIIDRLDLTYADKSLKNKIKQNLSTVREGHKKLMQPYTEMKGNLNSKIKAKLQSLNGM